MFAAGFDQHVLKPTDCAKFLEILKLAADRAADRAVPP